MRFSNITFLVLVIAVASLLWSPISYAHPGRTASDGCHYCRTNCSNWGVSWNVRHCHGGYTPPPTYEPSTIKNKPAIKIETKQIKAPPASQEFSRANYSASEAAGGEAGLWWLWLLPFFFWGGYRYWEKRRKERRNQ